MNSFLSTFWGRIYQTSNNLIRNRVAIGPGFKKHCRLEIRGPGRIVIGQNCAIYNTPGSKNKYVTLYTHSPDAIITIGDNARLFAARIACKFEITIGDNCLIEDASIFDTDYHSLDPSRADPPNESHENCKISIGNNSSIAAGSIVTKGVSIGSNTMVGPGAVVNRSLPENSFVMGNPARLIKKDAAN